MFVSRLIKAGNILIISESMIIKLFFRLPIPHFFLTCHGKTLGLKKIKLVSGVAYTNTARWASN